jgi:hypothetical protein
VSLVLADPAEGELRVLMGQRRTLAAIEVSLRQVPPGDVWHNMDAAVVAQRTTGDGIVSG